MDIDQILVEVGKHLTPLNVGLLISLLITTIMAENQSIKASSIYGLIRTVVLVLKDQMWPKPPVSTPVEPPAEQPKQ